MPRSEQEGARGGRIVRTRIGYYAMMTGAVFNVLAVAALFATGLFGTLFGVLVLATMFFVGLTIPYMIDWIAWRLSERGRE